MQKKVLIITYYWPPSGGGGVQRWLKFVKYLPQNGWIPVVYAPENAAYPLIDESLGEEVDPNIEIIKQPIWEPRKLYKKIFKKESLKASKKKDNLDRLFYIPKKERTWKQNLSIWIRGNLVIPDARIFWVRPSIRFLKNYLKKNPVDIIITTGPPHSLHLIGKGLKKALGIKWLADFRDPWTAIEYYDKLMLTGRADKKHKRLEREVIQQADGVIVVAPFWKKKYEEIGTRNCAVITNGYDEADFQKEPPSLSEKFLLTHAGTLANDRNPEMLWEVLAELKKEIKGFEEDLQIQVLGNTADQVLASLTKYNLKKQLINSGYVSHEEAIRIMQKSQILLLLINNVSFNAPGRMTGKIFEYLAARRPILLIGLQKSDPADVIRTNKAGEAIDFENKAKLKKVLAKYYSLFKINKLNIQSTTYQQYARKNLTRQLAHLLDSI